MCSSSRLHHGGVRLVSCEILGASPAQSTRAGLVRACSPANYCDSRPARGGRYLIYEEGAARPGFIKVTAQPARGQISLAWTLNSGRQLTGSVGRGAAIWDPPGDNRDWATAENWIDGTLPDEQDLLRIDRVESAPVISNAVKTGIIRVGQFAKGHLNIAPGAKVEAERLLLGAELAEGSARMRGGSVAVHDLAVGY